MVPASPVDCWLEKKGLELTKAHSVKELTRLYSTILLETCKNSEDPMQTTAFQTLSRRFAFRLVSALSLDIGLPEVMDIVTKVHFSAIDDLIKPDQRCAFKLFLLHCMVFFAITTSAHFLSPLG